MLNFLRKIRKSLIDSGSTHKYLLYAVGEIALVVIGILIALQINNWNEWRKDRLKEQNILHEVIANIEENISQFGVAIQFMERAKTSSEIILHFLSDSLPYSDTLSFHFQRAMLEGGTRYALSNTGYEELKNAGFDILLNDYLKREIITYYEVETNNINTRPSFRETEVANFHVYFRKIFRDLGGPHSLPLRPNEIKKDNYFRSIITSIYDTRNIRIGNNRSIQNESENLLQLIKNELGEDYTENKPSEPLSQ